MHPRFPLGRREPLNITWSGLSIFAFDIGKCQIRVNFAPLCMIDDSLAYFSRLGIAFLSFSLRAAVGPSFARSTSASELCIPFSDGSRTRTFRYPQLNRHTGQQRNRHRRGR